MKKLFNKRAIQFSQIPSVILLFVIATLFGSLGVLILGRLKDSNPGGVGKGTCYAWDGVVGGENCTSDSFNESLGYGISGVKELLSWNETIALIFIAVILISAVMLFGRGSNV